MGKEPINQMSRLRGGIQSFLGIIFSTGVILWLVINLDFCQVLLALETVNYVWVGLGLLAVLFTLWARVLRWQALLASKQVTASGTLQALVLGQLLNLLLPARLGDLGRAYLITQKGYGSQVQALGTVALEKLWDIGLLVGIVTGLSLLHPLPAWILLPARLTAVMGVLLLVGAVSLLIGHSCLMTRWKVVEQKWWSIMARWRWFNRMTGRFLDGLRGVQHPRIMLTAGGWSVVAWFFGAVTNLAILQAFHLPFSVRIATFLLVVLQMGVAVPSIPGRIGIFEGLCVVTLALFDIEASVALGYGVMLHIVVLCPPILFGLWWLLRLDVASRRVIWRLSP